MDKQSCKAVTDVIHGLLQKTPKQCKNLQASYCQSVTHPLEITQTPGEAHIPRNHMEDFKKGCMRSEAARSVVPPLRPSSTKASMHMFPRPCSDHFIVQPTSTFPNLYK
jgi:hypothetical protein